MSHKLMTYIYGANTVRVAVGGDMHAWFVLEDVCRELGIRDDVGVVMAGLHGAERALVGYEDGGRSLCAARCVSWDGLEVLVARVDTLDGYEFAHWARNTVLARFFEAREAASNAPQGRILARFRNALTRLGMDAALEVRHDR